MLEAMALLVVDNVTKTYGTPAAPVEALRGVSLQAKAAEFIALTGRSGCGKSTLLSLCGAMDFPTTGSVTIDGLRTQSLNDAALTRMRREKIGFIFQSFQLLQTLSVSENIELPLLLARQLNARKRAVQCLKWVELKGHEDRYPHQLSGGQQQRVAIARALAGNPRLVLADEPTGNLDSLTGETVLTLLSKTAREFGVAILMATHSEESTRYVNRVISMRDGLISTVEERMAVQPSA